MKQNSLQHKYSNTLHNKNILIIGPYPPPLGGVSIHIKRVVAKLKSQHNTVTVHDTSTKHTSKLSSLKSLFKTIRTCKPDTLIYHEPTESVQRLFIVTLLKLYFAHTLITVDHDCRLLYAFTALKKKLLHALLKQADSVVVIGNTTDKCYQDNAIKGIAYSIESPYLPPDLQEEHGILQSYPASAHHFMKHRTPLITANAFTPALVHQKDLYGFDLCIELIKALKKDHPRIGLLFGICVIKEEHKAYFKTIQQRIKELGLEENMYFFMNKGEFWAAIKQSDVFIRPTRSDSFGISIQEAISLDVPAIASDVCIRPQNTILFKSENTLDLIEKVHKAIKSR